jgi:putative transposase
VRSHNRKANRLDAAEYRGEKTVAFTACIKERKPVFVEPEVVQTHIEFLRLAASQASCLVPLFCFMPDHTHILIKGFCAESDMRLTMIKFKALSGAWLRREQRPGWQETFHDRILRADEWLPHARYIAMNPVRAGIVEDYSDYPYLGSLHGRVNDVFPD